MFIATDTYTHSRSAVVDDDDATGDVPLTVLAEKVDGAIGPVQGSVASRAGLDRRQFGNSQIVVDPPRDGRDYEVGDLLYSNQTGITYRVTAVGADEQFYFVGDTILGVVTHSRP